MSVEPGSFVSHPKFRLGKVLSASGDNIDVNFENDGEIKVKANSLTVLATPPPGKIWRLRNDGKSLTVSIERARLTKPALADAFESLLTELVLIVTEDFWKVDAESATLSIQGASKKGTRRRFFLGLDEKSKKPLHIAVQITETSLLPKEFHFAFKYLPLGSYFLGDAFRAEILEDGLAQMPIMVSALRAVIAAQSAD